MNQPEFSTYGQTIQATFDRLEECLQRAESLIPVARASELADLLPHASIDSQRFILSELIKLDMSTAAELGQARRLDFYLTDCEQWLRENEIPLDLILEELQIRRDGGESPTLEEYQRRFPRWASALADFQWERISTRNSGQSKSGLPMLEPGHRIEDFRVIQMLGQGAFAVVYLAMQESMNRLVALKVSSRGTDEPQTLSQLDHPNIVRVYDQRKLEFGQIHLLYMQAVLGGTLANVISATRHAPIQNLSGQLLFTLIDEALLSAQQQPPERSASNSVEQMDWATAVACLGWQLCEGLQSAHDQGVYHRDVKPANILLSAEGKPKLADFNVSHSTSNSEQSGMGGTLAYMSPEQLIASDSVVDAAVGPVDHRSDAYSLAVVLWELWQGQRPWASTGPSSSWREAVTQQLALRQQSPVIWREDRSSVGSWLQRVLRQTLSVDLDLRPQACIELGQRLKLAMYPELAARFAPTEGSNIDRLRRLPVTLVVALLALVPNGLAGALNYAYNWEVIIKQYLESKPQMQQDFITISFWINAVAFSLGAAILVYFSHRVRRSLNRAAANITASESDIDWVWKFGHRSAMIGAGLWLSFGLIFPIVIQWYQPEFRGSDFTHFFLSLAICGGIAWIYPYFGISLLSTIVYYPQLISPTMSDGAYAERARWMRRCADFYLSSAAVIPLVTLGLIITQPDSLVPSYLKLLLVVLAFLAVVFAFKAYQWLYRVIQQYERLLTSQSASADAN